ncbi:cysteine desulfurase [candidate division MSBL1 archaeon SCGC-AAA259E22]|uniref:cysteine desulfurase n=1 Tax=candidate division MSBL1 archaeon SCGC-AAA259E22 TaxID=1698265 RepID=A0A133UIH9_9EURY|nr:cysteine desulfurase [candidate division MSBL1 archaeon SCGC-AAA259E22]
MEKSVEEVRSEIPFLDSGIIYLDNAATTPTPESVIEAMFEYYHEYSANIGRGVHKTAKRATEAFESSRKKIAKVIGSDSKEVVYTKNTTEGLNLLAKGLNLEKGDKVIATVLDHHSNLIPWQRLEEEKGIELKILRECPDFVIDPCAVEEAIDERTRIVTMPSVSNAFGTRQPVEEVGEITQENDVLFSVDAAQSVGHMPVDVKEIECDFMAAPGHKGLLGPQGTGFLYVREELIEDIKPLLCGGGIVKGVEEHTCELINPPQVFDAGTPNIPGIIGLGKAAEYVLDIGLEKIERRERKLGDRILDIAELDNVHVYGLGSREKLGGVVSFNLEGLDSHEVSSLLDEIGNIATRSGHHCAEPAMKHFDIGGNVRASVHYYNTMEEMEEFLEVLDEISKELT